MNTEIILGILQRLNDSITAAGGAGGGKGKQASGPTAGGGGKGAAGVAGSTGGGQGAVVAGTGAGRGGHLHNQVYLEYSHILRLSQIFGSGHHWAALLHSKDCPMFVASHFQN